MAATRLNTNLRAKIRVKALNHRFERERLALLDRETALAAKVWALYFTPSERDLMASLPEGWLKEIKAVPFQAPGLGYGQLDSLVGLRVPANVNGNTCFANLTADHHLVPELAAYQHDSERYTNQRDAANEQLFAVLGSFHTAEKLIESYPNLTTFVSAACAEAGHGSPVRVLAVAPATLDAMLDLPPGD